MSLLKVMNLRTHFYTDGDDFPAVDDISFSVEDGRTLAIIGESGSGKSVTVLSIMRLIENPGRIVSGQILWNGNDLTVLKDKELRKIRGKEIAMVYQDPMTTLNPLLKVGKQIEEALKLHNKSQTKIESRQRVVELMTKVGIPDALERFDHYPNQFSGGMRQRLMIAMALANNPKLLIADEPTTALDVTIQAEILELLKALQEQNKMAIIINTHDLGVVAKMADDVMVMYCGKVMEIASRDQIFKNPMNPYTIGLMNCIPRIDDPQKRLQAIEGYVPHISNMPVGCRFSDRCLKADEKCKNQLPELEKIEEGHWSRCWKNKNK